MKKVLVPFILTAIAMTVFFLLPIQTEAKSEKASFTASITCDGCKNKIEKNMKDVDGVNTTSVDVETKTVSFDYDPEVITIADLKTKVTKLGYDVSEVSNKKCSTSDKECSTKGKVGDKECSTTTKKVASKDCGSKDNCCKGKAKDKE